MSFADNINALYTDYYELTMSQGYLLGGKQDDTAVFDYTFRDNPFGGGYVVFAGLDNLLAALQKFTYDEAALAFLEEQGFDDVFLAFLRDFRFQGTIYSVAEGEVVFPLAPVMRVEGTIIECQLIETLLLNSINFESLIATKASRIRRVAGNKAVSDFGLRRAQGLGGLQASRAALIGGVDLTSNVLAGHCFGLGVTGTQAHSWVQSFPDELAAFRAYAATYPDKTVLLVDTYDTLKSGVPNAIQVGREMAEKGHTLLAIRLDSGDLAYLSKQARKMLDEAGLTQTRILVSDQLDEYLVRSLNEQQAPVDGYGVGTELVTGRETAALDGVYKLAAHNGTPTLKLSNTLAKTSLPGRKQLCRYFNGAGFFYGDCVCLEGEDGCTAMNHPVERDKSCTLAGKPSESLLRPVMEQGRPLAPPADISRLRQYCEQRLAQLPEEHKRFEMPHIYKVGLSPALTRLRDKMITAAREGL
ncbi:MAG: nicotinate phosphoribosyltransferase [Desulfosudaceae bacterium]